MREAPATPEAVPCNETVMGLVNLANAIRDYGHLSAQIDPLGSQLPGDPSPRPGRPRPSPRPTSKHCRRT